MSSRKRKGWFKLAYYFMRRMDYWRDRALAAETRLAEVEATENRFQSGSLSEGGRSEGHPSPGNGWTQPPPSESDHS